MREWRFPRNEIISLLDTHRTHNLGESTSQDLRLGDLLDEATLAELAELRLGYGSSLGLAALRDEIARDCGVAPGEVLVTTGAALALFLVALELCRGAEDEIVVVTPCFPSTVGTMRASGATVRPHLLRFADGYRLNAEALAAGLSERTRLVSLTTPQNPSGIRVSADEVRRLVEVVARRAPQAYVMIDETYREATYGEAPPASLAAISPKVITCASISKAHGAPGLRIGWLTTRDGDLMERLTMAKMSTVISTSVVDETLALALLRKKDAILGERRQLLAAGLARMEAWHAGLTDLVDWLRPEGGALCCLRLKERAFADAAVEDFYQGLADHDLLISEGTWFGDERRVLRVGFGYPPPDALAPALDALAAALHSAAG